MATNRLPYFFTSVLVMFLWSLCYPLIAFGLSHVPPLQFAFQRALLSGILLLGIGALSQRPNIKGGRNWVYIVIIGLTSTSMGFWGMFFAGGILPPGLATLMTNTQPLIAAVLAWFVLSEHLGYRSIAGLVIGLAGTFLISVESSTAQNAVRLPGVLFVLTAALGVAIGNVLMKVLGRSVDVVMAMGWQLVIGAIPLGVLSFLTESSVVDVPDFRYLVVLSVLGIFGTALPFILWFQLLQRVALVKINPYNFLTPVFGLLLGRLFFDESLSALQWIGAVIVVIGIQFVSTDSRAALNSN